MYLVVFDGVVAEALPLSKAQWDLLSVTIRVHTLVKRQVPVYLGEGLRTVHVGLPYRTTGLGTVTALVVDRACGGQTQTHHQDLSQIQIKKAFCQQLESGSTSEDERGLGDMLVLQQHVDVKVRVGGVHSVSNQERPVVTIQDLDPNPGELLHRGHDLHVKGVLTGGGCETGRGRTWRIFTFQSLFNLT